MRYSVAWALGSFVLLAGCGGRAASSATDPVTGVGTDADGGGPCGFKGAPPVPAAVDSSAPLTERATAEQLLFLDALIGRYLRGEVRVYRGTVKAQDNKSQLVDSAVYGAERDESLSEGPAVAMLDIRTASSEDWWPTRDGPQGQSAFLVVHGSVGPTGDEHIVLEQPESDETLTEAGMVAQKAETDSLVLSCKNCGPHLWERPETLSFTDLTATGTQTVAHGSGVADTQVTARLVTSADLALAPVCSLRFEDLVILNSATGPYELSVTLDSAARSGNEMVWGVAGQFSAPTTPCATYTRYTAQAFVDLNDLSHYGIRNLELRTPTQECPI